MRFFYVNLIDLAGVVVTAETERATLPVENVINEMRARVYRTDSTQADEAITFDLGSAQAVKALILLDHTLTGADTDLLLEGSAAADFSDGPAFSQALTYAAGTILETFDEETLRYWRVSFTKSAAGQTRDIGRVFLGSYYDTEEEPDYSGYDEKQQDLSKKFKAISGQTYVDIQPQFHEINITFSQVSHAMSANLKTMIDYVGQYKSFFFQAQPAGTLNTLFYVKLDEAFGRKVAGFDANFVWDIRTMKFEEQL